MQELKRVKQQYGCTSSELLKKTGLLNSNLMGAHGLHLNEDDYNLLSEADANIVHIPEGNAKSGRIAPVYTMQKEGINVCIGTDNGSQNIIENMRIALIVGRIKNQSFTNPTPQKILDMATINGAKAIKKQDILGSIEVGKLADLTIVNYENMHMTPCNNVLGDLIHLATGTDVETVFVDGKEVVSNGKVNNIDEKKLMKEARRIASLHWHRSDPKFFAQAEYIF